MRPHFSPKNAAPILSGYLYQFERSVLRLLQLPSERDLVTFEGIEDIDLISGAELTAIQFKYFPSKVLTPSIVRWTVLEMLEAFAESKRPLRYELFIYCTTKKEFRLETVADLKRLAIYDERSEPRDFIQEKNYSDELVARFMNAFTFTVGISLEDSHASVVSQLAEQFHCSTADAEEYYYPRAIELCIRTSTKPERIDRTMSKKEFCTAIDGKSNLFARWQAEATNSTTLKIVKSFQQPRPTSAPTIHSIKRGYMLIR